MDSKVLYVSQSILESKVPRMSLRSLIHSRPQSISCSLSFAHPVPFLLLLLLPLPQGCTTLRLLFTSCSCFSVGSSIPISAYQSQHSASPLAKLAETSGPTPDSLGLVGKSGSEPRNCPSFKNGKDSFKLSISTFAGLVPSLKMTHLSKTL